MNVPESLNTTSQSISRVLPTPPYKEEFGPSTYSTHDSNAPNGLRIIWGFRPPPKAHAIRD